MIIPGKDDNYPGGSMAGGANNWSFMPHTIVGMLFVFIILFIAWNLFAKPKRRR